MVAPAELSDRIQDHSEQTRVTGASARLTVAYLVNRYPKVSHAFIRREIAAVERCGVRVERFSIRPATEAFPDEGDRVELSKTRVVLKHPAAMLWSVAAVALSRPAKFAKAL